MSLITTMYYGTCATRSRERKGTSEKVRETKAVRDV